MEELHPSETGRAKSMGWMVLYPPSVRGLAHSGLATVFEHKYHVDIMDKEEWLPCWSTTDWSGDLDTVHQVTGRLLAVLSDDEFSRKAYVNALLAFPMHVQATHATCHVLEEFHCNWEAFDTLATQPIAIPDKEIKLKLHLWSPWLLWWVLKWARMIDQKLTMGHIAEDFKTDLFIIILARMTWRNSLFVIVTFYFDPFIGTVSSTSVTRYCRRSSPAHGCLVVFFGLSFASLELFGQKYLQCSVSGGQDKGDEGLGWLSSIPGVNQLAINWWWLKEWIPETDGVNLKAVICLEIFDTLKIGA
ncbi:hypothetical protein EDC04DRAFT_2614331 [Pisolithus marmoratus]|nr:hypothetical protein EDC04DRAFT_2614331 [Pisolithus marmoratus]